MAQNHWHCVGQRHYAVPVVEWLHRISLGLDGTNEVGDATSKQSKPRRQKVKSCKTDRDRLQLTFGNKQLNFQKNSKLCCHFPKVFFLSNLLGWTISLFLNKFLHVFGVFGAWKQNSELISQHNNPQQRHLSISTTSWKSHNEATRFARLGQKTSAQASSDKCLSWSWRWGIIPELKLDQNAFYLGSYIAVPKILKISCFKVQKTCKNQTIQRNIRW